SSAAQAQVRISQVYGGGGNAGAPYRNDFVELFNTGTADVDVSGWSVKYSSSTGTFNSTNSQITIIPAGKIVQAGHYFLVQLASGGAVGANLPTPDVIGATNMSATVGKVALCSDSDTNTYTCATLPNIVDLVGWGSAVNCSETAPAPAPSNTTAIFRAS